MFFLSVVYMMIFLRYVFLLSPSIVLALPQDWQMSLQEAASTTMEKLTHFHDLLLYIIIAVVVFVFLLLAYTCIRFYHKNNPIPQKFTHNVAIEVVWTIIPFIILIVIAIPSFRILYYSNVVDKMDMTIKVVGRQWYWQYEYPDEQIAFDSYMIQDKELKPGQLRLLDVDNELVLPVDTNIRILITAGDVIHSFAAPSLGIKIDAVPGRINETWVRITKSGKYYGQCSELCGIGHGFMPISIKALSKNDYQTWIKDAKIKFSNQE
jgi:cytochrome c oxidase subunit II